MEFVNVAIKAAAIYIGLLIAMKLLGKRQAGEMQISELITTFLVSEIATYILLSAVTIFIPAIILLNKIDILF